MFSLVQIGKVYFFFFVNCRTFLLRLPMFTRKATILNNSLIPLQYKFFFFRRTPQFVLDVISTCVFISIYIGSHKDLLNVNKKNYISHLK